MDVLPDPEGGAAGGMSVFLVSYTLPQVLAPAILAPIIHALNHPASQDWSGYRWVFGSAALWFLLATVMVSRNPRCTLRLSSGGSVTVSTAADYTGSLPVFYDRCLGPVLFEPYAADLADRVPVAPGLRVLELACGTGVLTRRLRAALPKSASLVATDLNDAMVSYAQAALPQSGIEWRTADAQALPFADASFDAVACQFGFMFLPDKPQGFREARRVLRPRGMLLANVWHSMDENPFVRAMHTRLGKEFPDDPPHFLLTPYGYHDTDQLRADVAEAGWEAVGLEDVRFRSVSPSAAEIATGFVRGTPLHHELVARNADLDRLVSELADSLIPVGGDSPFTASLAATLITAPR